MLIILLSLIIIQMSFSLMNESPYFLGTYLLRKTNDKSIKSTYTYLTLNENNSIKLKTIDQNGIFATKISRTGSIEFIKNRKTILNPIYHLTFNKMLNDVVMDNDIDIIVKFNSVNKYSYSVLGIEFPEIKYKEILNYNIEKLVRVKQKNYNFYITDKQTYYLFDLCPNLIGNKLPYVETPINTLIFTQILGFISNLILVKFLDLI